MTFHTKMYAAVQGFEPEGDLRSLVFDDMAVDYWRVHGHAQARGRYVSMHPRVVMFLDDRVLSISKVKEANPRKCAACYIPAGVQIWGHLDEPGELKHVDIHLTLGNLKDIVGADTRINRPLFLPFLGPLAPLARFMRAECIATPCNRARVKTLVRAILNEMFQLDRAITPSDGREDEWLDTLRDIVFERMGHRISVDELAERSHLSRTHFNRLFRSKTGLSPYAWILQMKIAYAIRLLKQGMPIADVTNVTGFADQAHFSRVFKDEIGTPPGQWAKSNAILENGPILQDRLTH